MDHNTEIYKNIDNVFATESILDFFRPLGESLNSLEEVLESFHKDRCIQNATGEILERHAKNYGLNRGTLNDNKLRGVIIAKIASRWSKGTIQDIIRILRLMTPPGNKLHTNVVPGLISITNIGEDFLYTKEIVLQVMQSTIRTGTTLRLYQGSKDALGIGSSSFFGNLVDRNSDIFFKVVGEVKNEG